VAPYQLTLDRLAQAFTVRDIMVPRIRLICAPDEPSARTRLVENTDHDVIAIEQDGNVVSYLERGGGRQRPIRVEDMVSDSTSILDLVEVLQHRVFCYVVGAQRIVGYVHFSDLNNHLAKLPYFVLFEAIESRVANLIGDLITEAVLGQVLDPQRCDSVRKAMGRQRSDRSDLGWCALLTFNELIRCAVHFGRIRLRHTDIEVISKVRNLVAHVAGEPLVETHADVKRLVLTRSLCMSTLEWLQQMSA
jgi:hypothetical protein